MPRFSVYDRLRFRLQRWLKQEGHGAQAALVRFSQKRPGGSRISPQQLSNFLQQAEGRAYPIQINHLDDIAAFFNKSLGELFDEHPTELSGAEHRILWAFRALPVEVQEHFLSLVEAASMMPRIAPGSSVTKTLRQERTLPDNPPSSSVEVISGGSASYGFLLSESLRQYLTALSVELQTLSATGEVPHRSLASAGDHQAHTGERRS